MGLVVVNEQDNHDRQRLDSPLVYIGAHNVYYVKSYLSDTKWFSGSRYSFRIPELKLLLFHNWPVHDGYRLAGMPICRLPHLPSVEDSSWQTACKWARPLSINTSGSLREWVHSGIRNGYVSMKSGERCWMNITMSPQQPMLSVTKAYPISDGNICGCLESHLREILPG